MRIRRRSHSIAAAVVCVLALLAMGSPAHTQTTQERLDAARRDAARIKSDLQRIAEGFAAADDQQHNTEHRILETEEEIEKIESDVTGLQGKLKERVRQAYRMRGIGFFQFLLEARNFSDFNLRVITLQRQTLQDEDLVLQLRKKRSELTIKERQLAAANDALKDRVAEYRTQGQRATISLQQANRLADQLRGQLSREQVAKLFSISRTTGGRIIPMEACPVDPPNIVTNSWGAPRGGGTRRHQGNDIMADQGIGIRATNDGTITRTGSGGLGGLSIYLWDGSTEYYYAHLSRISVRSGQKVSGGQLIGANGDTGNAQGGPPHLHFEIHPGGGGAIDPYPSLSVVC